MLLASKELDEETGLYYYGARYYDAKTSVWQSVDPPMLDGDYIGSNPRDMENGGVFNSSNLGVYNYSFHNPVNLTDPNGKSPVSVLIKQVAKVGLKKGLKHFGEKVIKRRLGRYMTKKHAKEFASDLADVLGTLDSSWWEIALEFVPVVGDLYGAGKFAKKIAKAYDKLQDLENKWIGKIADGLPKAQRDKFIENMRKLGVSDAKKDIDARKLQTGKVEVYKGKQGHHRTSVSADPSKAADPRGIEFASRRAHLKRHRGNFRNRTRSSVQRRRN